MFRCYVALFRLIFALIIFIILMIVSDGGLLLLLAVIFISIILGTIFGTIIRNMTKEQAEKIVPWMFLFTLVAVILCWLYCNGCFD